MEMNRTELVEAIKTLKMFAERHSLSEELNFSFKYNAEAEALLIDCRPHHSRHLSKILDVRKSKEKFLDLALDFLEECRNNEQAARIDNEIEQEEAEQQEEELENHERETENLLADIEALVEEYNEEQSRIHFSYTVPSDYEFEITASIEDEVVESMKINCSDIDSNYLLAQQDAINFFELTVKKYTGDVEEEFEDDEDVEYEEE